MRVPYSWLREYCAPDLGVEELGALLALRTTEVERIAPWARPSSNGFVVGRVVSVERHPDADRLSVCEVETGDSTRTIVCGPPTSRPASSCRWPCPARRCPEGGARPRQAPRRHVRRDDPVGGRARDGRRLGRDNGAGTMPRPPRSTRAAASAQRLAPGTPLGEVLPFGERVLELEVSSNRVDCFGVYGVAREVHAFTGSPLASRRGRRTRRRTGDGRPPTTRRSPSRFPSSAPGSPPGSSPT